MTRRHARWLAGFMGVAYIFNYGYHSVNSLMGIIAATGAIIRSLCLGLESEMGVMALLPLFEIPRF
jgi:hypothetical protein